MARRRHPVIIIGGGPAGSAAAMYLLRLGITPVIVEREEHPRFRIGESLTGPTALALKDLGLGPAIEAQRYPVKEGVMFHGPDGKNNFWVPLVRRNENFEQVPNYTWNVLRSTFDKVLFDAALDRGAVWIRATAVAPIVEGDAVVGLTIRSPEGATENLLCDVLIDASGSATFLANHRVTGKKLPGSSDKQVSFFSQFANTIRDHGTDRSEQPGNTLLYYQAQHYWGWFIPVTEELTSVGIVVTTEHFKRAGLSKDEFFLRECRQMTPVLSKRLPDLNPREAIHAIPNFSYRVRNFTGKGFLCIGDAHRFIDPIFAFGVFFGIQEAEFAARAIADHLSGTTKGDGNPFAEFERVCNQGNDVVEDVAGVLWNYPLAFQRIVIWRDRAAGLDILSGRIYGEEGATNPARIAMRSLMAKDAAKRASTSSSSLESAENVT